MLVGFKEKGLAFPQMVEVLVGQAKEQCGSALAFMGSSSDHRRPPLNCKVGPFGATLPFGNLFESPQILAGNSDTGTSITRRKRLQKDGGQNDYFRTRLSLGEVLRRSVGVSSLTHIRDRDPDPGRIRHRGCASGDEEFDGGTGKLDRATAGTRVDLPFTVSLVKNLELISAFTIAEHQAEQGCTSGIWRLYTAGGAVAINNATVFVKDGGQST